MNAQSQRSTRAVWASVLLGALLGTAWGESSSATGARWLECVGYYTVRLPGDIDYAVQQPPLTRLFWEPQFPDGLGVWHTSFDVETTDTESREVRISSETTLLALKALANKKNEERLREKNEALRMAAAVEKLGYGSESKTGYLQDASRVQFYESLSSGAAFGAPSQTFLDFHVLIDNRIISASHRLKGTPQQTLDEFLRHYRARAPFDVPAEQGVCLPYAFIIGAGKKTETGISLRLKNRPDIVVYLSDQKIDLTSPTPRSIEEIVNKAVQRGYFYGAKYTEPLDGDLRPFRSIKIDGREGLGGFALITRDPAQQSNLQITNTANNDKDWGYLAYVPGDKNAPAGASSDLIFKVERFGRFAKQPMTEKEFRELVMELAAGIRRRPGAGPTK